LPVGDVKVKVRDTVPFAAAVPDESASESVWPNAACVISNKKNASSGLLGFRSSPIFPAIVLVVPKLTFSGSTS